MKILFLGFLSLILISCNRSEELNVESLPSLAESKVDLALVALQLAKEVYPDIDIEEYNQKLESMAKDIKLKTKGITDPDFRIRVMNTYLYKEQGFGYNFDDPTVKNPSNRYLNGLLDTKKGSCITLPLLYVVLAQKLGYPVYPVLVPDHVFARYMNPTSGHQNIEATGGGRFVPDWKYKEDFQVSDAAFKSGAHLKALSYKEYLSELVSMNAGYYFFEKRDHEKGLNYINLALKLRPITPENYRMKAQMIYALHKKFMEQNEHQKALVLMKEAEELKNKSVELGFIRLSREEYLKSVEAKKNKQSNQGRI